MGFNCVNCFIVRYIGVGFTMEIYGLIRAAEGGLGGAGVEGGGGGRGGGGGGGGGLLTPGPVVKHGARAARLVILNV